MKLRVKGQSEEVREVSLDSFGGLADDVDEVFVRVGGIAPVGIRVLETGKIIAVRYKLPDSCQGFVTDDAGFIKVTGKV